MNKITFKFNDGLYFLANSTFGVGEILASFLTSNVGYHVTSWIEWINEDVNYASGNSSILVKKEGKVYIWDMFDQNEEVYFETSIENYTKILTAWEKFYREEPKEIIITIDDHNVSIEGKN